MSNNKKPIIFDKYELARLEYEEKAEKFYKKNNLNKTKK